MCGGRDEGHDSPLPTPVLSGSGEKGRRGLTRPLSSLAANSPGREIIVPNGSEILACCQWEEVAAVVK